MAVSLEAIATQAAVLPADQRYVLAHRILAGLEPAPTPASELAWDKEIRRRIRRHDAGLSPAIPGAKVFAELDRALRQ